MRIFWLLFTFLGAIACAKDTPILSSPWKAPDGTELINPKIASWDAATVSIVHEDGIAKYEIGKLSPELKAALGYDQEAAVTATAAQAVVANQRAKAALLEQRFSAWEQELARKKTLALHAPGELLRSGAGVAQTAEFRENASDIVSQFENRLKRLRQLVAQLDATTADPGAVALLISNVYNEKISIGMPRDAVLLSWGPPTDINRSLHGNASYEQLVYRHGNARADYVYIDANGFVSAIQN